MDYTHHDESIGVDKNGILKVQLSKLESIPSIWKIRSSNHLYRFLTCFDISCHYLNDQNKKVGKERSFYSIRLVSWSFEVVALIFSSFYYDYLHSIVTLLFLLCAFLFSRHFPLILCRHYY
jgi:hypothetical protein